MLRYAITDRTLSKRPNDKMLEALVRQCARWAREGIDFVQLREKDLPPPEFAEVSRQVLEAVRAGGERTRLLLNSHVDTAVLIGGDGVHLSAEAWSRHTPREIRARFAAAGLPEPFVSVSCHTLDEVRRAREEGFSAILFGPVFGKTVEGKLAVQPAGLHCLWEACQEARPVPVLALGGVTRENTQACLDAGAAGIAGIRLFFGPGSLNFV